MVQLTEACIADRSEERTITSIEPRSNIARDTRMSIDIYECDSKSLKSPAGQQQVNLVISIAPDPGAVEPTRDAHMAFLDLTFAWPESQLCPHWHPSPY